MAARHGTAAAIRDRAEERPLGADLRSQREYTSETPKNRGEEISSHWPLLAFILGFEPRVLSMLPRSRFQYLGNNIALSCYGVRHLVESNRLDLGEGPLSAQKTPTVPALERGLAVLELVAKSRNGLTFSQVSRHFDFPKSSIHCLMITLERLGYLQRLESSGRFVAGLNLVRIASAASHGITLRQKAGPLLTDLAQRTGLTVHMAVLENSEALLIAKVEPSGTRPVATWVGKRIDYHCTSLGKALIAWLPDDEIRSLVREHHMLRHNENTMSTCPN